MKTYLRSEIIINEDGTTLETLYRPDGSKEKEILYSDANDGINDGADRARKETYFAKDGKTINEKREYKECNNRNLPHEERKTNMVKMQIFAELPKI